MVSVCAEVMTPADEGARQAISTVPGTGCCSGSGASLNADGSCLLWAYHLRILETSSGKNNFAL